MVFGHSGMNLEIHNRRKVWKCTNMWNYEGQRKKKVTREIFKSFDVNENKNTPHQNLPDAAKEVLTVKFKVVDVYIIKVERSHNLTLHLNKLEKEEQECPKQLAGRK